MIEFTCPECQRPLQADPSTTGQQTSCPYCQVKFNIPEYHPDEPFFLEESDIPVVQTIDDSQFSNASLITGAVILIIFTTGVVVYTSHRQAEKKREHAATIARLEKESEKTRRLIKRYERYHPRETAARAGKQPQETRMIQRWSHPTPETRSIELWQLPYKLLMIYRNEDNSSIEIEVQKSAENRYNQIDRWGNAYYLITDSGDLEVYDRNGKLYTARKLDTLQTE